MDADTMREIAVHEAGHAIASMFLGWPAGCAIFEGDADQGPGGLAGDDASIREQPDPANYTRDSLAESFATADPHTLLARATVWAAGGAAVELANIRPTIPPTGDRRGIDACGALLMRSDSFLVLTPFADLARANARRLLGPVFHRLVDVADALAARGRLTAADVAAIVDGTNHLPNATNQG